MLIHNMGEVFTLSWDNFSNKCPKVFKELWRDRDLSDVTLATEDWWSAECSQGDPGNLQPPLQNTLVKEPHYPPHVVPYGSPVESVAAALSYIYLGQCDLIQDQLPAFMATGKQLEVKGLSGIFEGSKSTR